MSCWSRLLRPSTRYVAYHLAEQPLTAQLPLPPLLQEARTSLLWSELSAEEKVMMNGWVRALVSPAMRLHAKTLTPSSDLTVSMMRHYCTCYLSPRCEQPLTCRSTTPQNFCRLGCGLFQQAVTATAIDQIDLDTLHSGLSYFCQPLLSWSLGGIVTWLCKEALRLGYVLSLTD